MLIPLLATVSLQAQCLDQENTQACDRWIAGLARPSLSQLQRACAFEAPFACGRLAKMTRDHALSTRALIVACRADTDACRRLAVRLDDTRLDPALRTRARAAVRRSCLRSSDACYALGRQHLNRKRVRAARWALERGCRGDDARACVELAWRLERGDGLPKDARSAARFGDRACRGGDERLCQHRLRQRQARRDFAGIRRACRRGDALSCAARDARRCRRGDSKACARAAAAPVGACRQTHQICPTQTYIGQPCQTVSSCDGDTQRQRRAAAQALRSIIDRCGVEQARLDVRFSRSGDVYRRSATPSDACLDAALDALQVPSAASPTRLRGRIGRRNGRLYLSATVEATRGAPHPPLPDPLAPHPLSGLLRVGGPPR